MRQKWRRGPQPALDCYFHARSVRAHSPQDPRRASKLRRGRRRVARGTLVSGLFGNSRCYAACARRSFESALAGDGLPDGRVGIVMRKWAPV